MLDRGLVSSSIDQTLKVWDLFTGEESFTFHDEAAVLCAAFSKDGLRIASGSEDKTVKFWAPAGHESRTLMQKGSGIRNVTFDHQGRRIASVDRNTCRVWDAASGESLLEDRRLAGYGANARIAWAPDGKLLAIGPQIVNAATREPDGPPLEDRSALRESRYEGTGTAFSPDGNYLAAVTGKGMVCIWERKTGQCRFKFSEAPEEPFCLAFSRDGKYLAIGGSSREYPLSGLLQIWDIGSQEIVLSQREFSQAVFCVSYSPDGKRIAAGSGVLYGGVGSSPSEIRVYDTSTNELLYRLRGKLDRIYSVSFSPDSKRLASAGGGAEQRPPGGFTIWDMRTGLQLAVWPFQSTSVYGVEFSPDGRRLATASADGTIKIWDGTPLAETPRYEPLPAN